MGHCVLHMRHTCVCVTVTACAGAEGSKYDLVANIVHDGRAGEGTYRAHVQRKAEEIWYEVQVRACGVAGALDAQTS